jgi:transketolase
MRNAFASQLFNLAGQNKKIVLLSADIGNRLFNEYKSKYPDRFFNCGVAESNMTGMAAGMAMNGLIPVTYTITPFNTYRCLEHIRVDICYHQLHVIIVGVGSGLAYANLGATHQSCEDIAIMSALPHMTVVCPGDPLEVRFALEAALNYKKPVYIRLGKKNEPSVHKELSHFQIGKAIPLHFVDQCFYDVCIISTGTTLPLAVESAKILNRKHISSEVVSSHTVKPLDTEFLASIANAVKLIVTIEEHSSIGGLGSLIAQWLIENDYQKTKVLQCATPDSFLQYTGGHQHARQQVGLTENVVVQKILNKLAN